MIAAYIDNLENSQLNRVLISELTRTKNAGLVVNDDIFPTNVPLSMFSPVELHHIEGTIITFNLDNSMLAQKALGPSKNIFYVWDLEWMRGKNNYLHNVEIYHKADRLICRSESHQKIIQNYCNRKPEVENIDAIIRQCS